MSQKDKRCEKNLCVKLKIINDKKFFQLFFFADFDFKFYVLIIIISQVMSPNYDHPINLTD